MLPDPKDPSYLGSLVYFHHAAESLSFSKAAQALNVTPSAVSHRITALEEAIGKRLFERRVREVRLTQDGADLARATSVIWSELTEITSRLKAQEVLRVSVGPYLSSQWLLPRIGGRCWKSRISCWRPRPMDGGLRLVSFPSSEISLTSSGLSRQVFMRCGRTADTG
jgi:DNA-binding transcriptional ArsR family regulator